MWWEAEWKREEGRIRGVIAIYHHTAQGDISRETVSQSTEGQIIKLNAAATSWHCAHLALTPNLLELDETNCCFVLLCLLLFAVMYVRTMTWLNFLFIQALQMLNDLADSSESRKPHAAYKTQFSQFSMVISFFKEKKRFKPASSLCEKENAPKPKGCHLWHQQPQSSSAVTGNESSTSLWPTLLCSIVLIQLHRRF